MATDYEHRLRRVVDHIHDHPADDLSLDALADVAALSRFHFHRVYNAVVGETAANTVRRMRLHRAAVALAQGTDPISTIAKRVGYPQIASFTRAFSGHYGLTPAAFRNRGELRPFPLLLARKGPLMFPVITRTDPERRLAAVPHKGPYPEIGRAFEKLGSTVAARGFYGRFGHMVGVYYDSTADVRPADLRSHAGLEAPADMALEPPLEEVRLPAGRHAVLTFTGPYAGLPAAYDQLLGVWLPASGEVPADAPIFEVYLNSPMDTAPEDLVTEICLPLR
ncbi:MAG: AraC family transcriptional regulator [Rhodobacteraceae bacterium]|nr:AraC family transcriptional regulator [Paracoccaceae bacterium]